MQVFALSLLSLDATRYFQLYPQAVLRQGKIFRFGRFYFFKENPVLFGREILGFNKELSPRMSVEFTERSSVSIRVPSADGKSTILDAQVCVQFP